MLPLSRKLIDKFKCHDHCHCTRLEVRLGVTGNYRTPSLHSIACEVWVLFSVAFSSPRWLCHAWVKMREGDSRVFYSLGGGWFRT